MGAAGERGIGVFADVAGKDSYEIKTPGECFGHVDREDSFAVVIRREEKMIPGN